MMPGQLDKSSEATSMQMNLNEREIERRLRFVDFTPDDATRVTALTDVIVTHVDELVSAFFEHLAGFEEAVGLVQNPALMDTARKLKAEHLRDMVRGMYGIAYVEGRIKLGTLYAKAGLDPRVFLGAFHQMMRAVGFRVMKHNARNPSEGFEDFMAFKKLAFFDLSVIIDVIVFERERIIAAQNKAIRELSTPVLQVRDRLLIMPMIGSMDTQRARQMTESLLEAIRTRRARVVVLDVTGVRVIDSGVAGHIVDTVFAARLMGASTVLTGLSTEMAQALATLNIDLTTMHIVGDLQGGVEEAERLIGALSVNGRAVRPESKQPTTA